MIEVLDKQWVVIEDDYSDDPGPLEPADWEMDCD